MTKLLPKNSKVINNSNSGEKHIHQIPSNNPKASGAGDWKSSVKHSFLKEHPSRALLRRSCMTTRQINTPKNKSTIQITE